MKILHASATPETAHVVRFWVFGIWCVILALDPLVDLAALPNEVYWPGAPLDYLPRRIVTVTKDAWFLYTLKFTAIVASALMAWGVRTRYTGLTACALLTVHQAAIRGFASYINHAEITLLLIAYVFTLCAWADAWAKRRSADDDGPPTSGGFVLVLSTLILTVPYALMGIYRLTHGGLTLVTDSTIIHFAYSKALLFTEHSIGLGRYAYEYPVLGIMLRLGFPLVTLVEVLAPLALVSVNVRRLFIVVMLSFHLGAWLVMNIFFWENVLLLVLLFDLDRWFAPKPAGAKGLTLFFDGVCGLCNHFIDWTISHDRLGIIRYGPLQGQTAEQQLGPPNGEPESWTIILIDEQGRHDRSDAVLRALGRLGGLLVLTRPLMLLPRALRDTVYRFIARHRYRFFGQHETCRMPTEQERARFVP